MWIYSAAYLKGAHLTRASNALVLPVNSWWQRLGIESDRTAQSTMLNCRLGPRKRCITTAALVELQRSTLDLCKRSAKYALQDSQETQQGKRLTARQPRDKSTPAPTLCRRAAWRPEEKSPSPA